MPEIDDAVTTRARARVGQVLRGKWRLDKLLGVGGMACVFAGTHRNGKRGAVKMLHLELSIHEDAKQRFLREGYVANKVDHPGAVSVLDDDIADDGAVFLVMELLEGETVDARVQKRAGSQLSVQEVIAIADQLLDVLVVAHEKGIVHRDLKPENLFLTTKEQLKVLDFGIARLRELSSTNQATRTGSVMGTPAFMPPEQALGNWDAVDGRTDVWAVGATMFRLLTGRAVHEADTINKLLLAAMTKPAPPIQSVMPAIPPAFAAIIDRALKFEQAERWPDARAMQQALRQLAGAAPAVPAGLFPGHTVGRGASGVHAPAIAQTGSSAFAPSQPGIGAPATAGFPAAGAPAPGMSAAPGVSAPSSVAHAGSPSSASQPGTIALPGGGQGPASASPSHLGVGQAPLGHAGGSQPGMVAHAQPPSGSLLTTSLPMAAPAPATSSRGALVAAAILGVVVIGAGVGLFAFRGAASSSAPGAA